PDGALAQDIRACGPGVLAALAPDWGRPGLLEAVRAAGAAGLRVADGTAARVAGTGYAPGRAHFTAPAGTAASMLTSGTTGVPKRVAITLDGLAHAVHSATVHHEGDRADAPPRLRDATSIIDLPLFNVTSYLDIAMTAAAGRRICLMRRFEPLSWGQAVRDHRVVVALL